MTSLDVVKSGIQRLYKSNPKIHISVSMSHPKISLKNEPVTITGVYNHIFQIEETTFGSPKRHTLQYADVLTNRIEIAELL